jgi:3-phenylpropionate/trans-cinnamate dioxygenase ferredoxin reductase component
VVAAPAASARTKAVVVGAGPAGDAVCAGLRDGRFEGDITLVGAEPETPYERPHLSKGYLLGKVAHDRLRLRPAEQYKALQIELVLGRRAVELDAARHIVRLDDGDELRWDVACLATGSDARRLASGMYLRELPEADRLKRTIDERGALDIIGAGFIGCEVAAAAAVRGCAVRVHEALEQPMVRVLGPEVGSYLAIVHREHGVDLRLNASAPQPDDATLVAIGSVPRTTLAENAGIAVDGGIVVDELGRTSAPDVFAAGDGSRFFHPHYRRHIRVEHFQTSQAQGYFAGVAMAGNPDPPPHEVPWFWSDQYDLNLQYAGAGMPWDETVVRGELGRPPFSVFYLAGGELVGVLGINDHHTVARARRAMQRRASLTRQQLEDPTFDLRRALA